MFAKANRGGGLTPALHMASNLIQRVQTLLLYDYMTANEWELKLAQLSQHDEK